eukprot:TRINITY_DN19201_c0_g5_i1.p1 TRINITY_DN19201_c0_g5~~TRINITY_DN19201_c0_g5_i1.p1  ORF type:complete len:333 (+),score=84.79 TRINITY_DN19201_c0_g5_i1:60-1001(+)
MLITHLSRFTEGMENILCAGLVSHDGEVSRDTVLAGKEYVMLYFSASWCGPCRGFTPKLVEFYNSYAEKLKFEVVLLGGDKSEEDMMKYFEQMPWVAVPYKERDLKASLSAKYDVRSIPTIITLDKGGNVVATNARNMVLQDPTGNGFPWADGRQQATVGASSLGEVLLKRDGTTVEKSVLDGKYVLLYFSAHWCPPCRKFTPVLKQFWEDYSSQRSDLAIVFISSDRDELEFKEYFSHHGDYYAIPYADVKRRSELKSFYEIRGIPGTVLLSPSQKILRKELRDTIGNGAAAVIASGWEERHSSSSCCCTIS